MNEQSVNMPIGVFDTGAGGISVLNECRSLLPSENFIYYADNRQAPYGNKPLSVIERLTQNAAAKLFGMGIKALLIACNTAFCVSATALRQKYSSVVIGVEPAIKPAAATLREGKMLVLCTHATAQQDKFKRLLSTYDTGQIIVAPQTNLAALIEANLDSLRRMRNYVYCLLEPYLNNAVTQVVLGCTHYVLIRNIFEEACEGRAAVFDGNSGTAQQLKRKLKDNRLLNESGQGTVRLLSSAPLPKAYKALVVRHNML